MAGLNELSPVCSRTWRPIKAGHHRCKELSKTFPGYTQNIWGITSSMSATGYLAWGRPAATVQIDGSVVPCAAGGSLMLTPDICLPALHQMKDRFDGQIWQAFGFADAFNPLTGWVASDTLGLNVGIMLLSAESLRHASVWRWFMENRETSRAIQLAGIGDSPQRAHTRQE